jgi:hypothetical protein
MDAPGGQPRALTKNEYLAGVSLRIGDTGPKFWEVAACLFCLFWHFYRKEYKQFG